MSQSQETHRVETLDGENELVLNNRTNKVTMNGKPIELQDLSKNIKAAFTAATDKFSPDVTPAMDVLNKAQAVAAKK
ncbi:MAG: hypothetical protein ACOYNL_01475 [Rickettsiales bacterium]